MPSQPSRAGAAASAIVGIVALIASLMFAASFFGQAPSPSPSRPSPSFAAQATARATPSISSPTAAPTVTAMASPSPTASPSASPSSSLPPLPSAPPAILSTTLSARDTGGAWRVNIQYPRFAAGSTPFADQINQTIKDDVETLAVEFEEGPAAVRTPGVVNTLTGSYSVALNTVSAVSFRLKTSEDTGGAHPADKVATITFDLATGNPVGFNDVFADPQAALAILSVKSRDLLRQSLGADYDPSIAEDGTMPEIANFLAWAPTAKGFEVTFQEYQVGAGGLGLPVITVPWSAFSTVLDPKGPVAFLAAR